MSNPESPARRADRCPLCGKISVTAHAPFCSQGCRDRDLLQWLGEGYRVPGRPAENADEED
jgi:endogenous inhibitor of DNA gyrase (YacG/DUF329 family)